MLQSEDGEHLRAILGIVLADNTRCVCESPLQRRKQGESGQHPILVPFMHQPRIAMRPASRASSSRLSRIRAIMTIQC